MSDAVLETLYDRWDDLKRVYRHHRDGVEQRVTSVVPLEEMVLHFFAAGQAALEQALLDDVITWQQHAALSRTFTAFHAYNIDWHIECPAGFEAKPIHPFGDSGAQYEVQAYLEIAQRVEHDLAKRRSEIADAYELGREAPRGESPQIQTAAGTVHFAAREFELSKETAVALVCYFSAFDEIAEQLEFGLLDVAIELGKTIGMDVSDLEETREEEYDW